jgi:glycosyltransferase involved in cell wall biosynthesis
LEYVALGVPVIAARTKTIAAYFDDTMVKFFRPGDVDELAACILDLYRNPSQRKCLAQNAGRFCRQYDWKRLAAEYVATVDRLLAM